jgi:hypothetical protein
VTTANGKRLGALLQWHQGHLGLYARVATKTGMTKGYVSLVASGLRRNEKIAAALARELEQLLATAPWLR